MRLVRKPLPSGRTCLASVTPGRWFLCIGGGRRWRGPFQRSGGLIEPAWPKRSEKSAMYCKNFRQAVMIRTRNARHWPATGKYEIGIPLAFG